MILPEPTELLVWSGVVYCIADAFMSAWNATMREEVSPRRKVLRPLTAPPPVARRLAPQECRRNSVARL